MTCLPLSGNHPRHAPRYLDRDPLKPALRRERVAEGQIRVIIWMIAPLVYGNSDELSTPGIVRESCTMIARLYATSVA